MFVFLYPLIKTLKAKSSPCTRVEGYNKPIDMGNAYWFKVWVGCRNIVELFPNRLIGYKPTEKQQCRPSSYQV